MSKGKTFTRKPGGKPNSQNRNFKSTSKGKDMDKPNNGKKFPCPTVTTEKMNDVSWYSKNDQMLKDAASFSYNRPLGSKIDMSKYIQSTSDAPITYAASSQSIPGVMTMYIAPGPGLSTDYNSPINLAAQNIYSFVRYNNSGASNYEPADLMFYMLSMDSGYQGFNFLKRAYGILRSYSQSNWYYPRVFIESMGLDFDDLMANISDFRLFINTYAARLQSFCVPAVMPLFIRHSWMYSNIWKDSNEDKAQSYMFSPLFFYNYQELSQGGGSLEPVKWMNFNTASSVFNNQFEPELKTFSEVVQYFTTLINSLSLSEDIGIMSGDILKAYGQGSLFTLSPVADDYIVEPVYNEEVLNQIHNATVLLQTVVPDLLDSSWRVIQNVNSQTIIYNPQLPHEPTNFGGVMVNMPWNDVTPANTMVATRLTACYTSDDQDSSYFNALGSECVVYAMISFNNYNPASGKQYETEWYSFKSVLRYYAGAMSNAGQMYPSVPDGQLSRGQADQVANSALQAAYNAANEHITIIALLEQFDWHPLVYNYLVFRGVGNDDAVYRRVLTAINGDISKYTFIEVTELAQMHLTAIMSEFNIPQIGSF